MPKYAARLSPDPDGVWVAAALELPNCWSRGASREEALDRLRQEIRYRIELCPCTGVSDDFVEVEVQRESAATGTAPGATTPWAKARPATAAPWSGEAGCPRGPTPPGSQSPPETSDRAAGSRRDGWRRWDD